MSVAVITGAGRGLGRGIALALAADGFDVVLGYHRDLEAAVATSEECEAMGVQTALVQGDTSRPETATSLAAAAAELGLMHVWVNNAGVSTIAPVLRTDPGCLRWMFEVNVIGVLHGMKAAAAAMTTNGQSNGRIVNLASDAGLQGFENLGGYAATKFAVIGLTQTLARELAGTGITVNAVCPGTAETAMNDAEWALEQRLTGEDLETVRSRYLADIPQGRFCRPSDVGAAVSYLCSDGAAFVTGQSLCVNGGTVLH